MAKAFDAVAWMRQRRAAIDEEDAGLTWEQKRRKTVAALEGDPLWERLKGRQVPPPVLTPRPSGEGNG